MKKKIQMGGANTQIIIIVVVIILLVSLIFGSYYYFSSYSVQGTISRNFMPFIHDAKLEKRVNEGAIPASIQGNEYNINFWIYINDYVYRHKEDKIIINRNYNPCILLTKEHNNLNVISHVETDIKNNIDDIESEEEETAINNCEIKNVQLQRWVNINVSLNDTVLDIFINGNLFKTCILNGYPKPNVGALEICPDGGFNGFISDIKFVNRSLSISEIKSNYRNGPSVN